MQRILAYVKENSLSPGDKLPPERKLASLLGTSRNSLREAIRALALQGRLQSRTGDGTYLLPACGAEFGELQLRLAASRRRVREIFALRRILEPGVAELAAQQVRPKDLLRLKALVLDQVRAQEKGQDDSALDAAFHFQLAEITGNQVLLDMLRTIQDVLAESRKEELQQPKRRKLSPKAHFAIIEALEEGDAARARQEMQRHLLEVETLALDNDADAKALAKQQDGNNDTELER